MRAVPLPLALLLLAVTGCSPDAPPPLPSPDGIGRDLIGTRFVFFEDAEGAKHWTIEEGEVRGVVVEDSILSQDRQAYRLRLGVTLVAPNRTIRGDLRAVYRLQEGAWAFAGAERADDDNFSVEEIAAVLYAASPAQTVPGDSLHDARDVRLEPIARYFEGTYTAPFDPYMDDVRAVLNARYEDDDEEDRSFVDLFRSRPLRADSLRRAAIGGLERRIAERYFNRTWTLFLLTPGEAPAPVRIRTRRAGFDGCRFLDGTVRAASASAAKAVHLATTSSTMGGRAVPGRALGNEELRAFLRMARARLADQGVADDRLDRLRTDRLYAVDLDGDGIASWVGRFSVAGSGAGDGAVHLILIVSPTAGVPTVELERVATFDAGTGGLDLIGVIDVDGDGRAEVILRESDYEAYEYRILSRPAPGDWTTVFRGGGGGC